MDAFIARMKEGKRMNKKGFTLVEVIAVISVLALVMIIVIPAVSRQFTNSKEALSKINRKNASESAMLFGTDVVTCDKNALNILKEKVSEKSDEAYCVTARDAISTGLEVSLDFLKSNNYLTDYDDRCSGNVIITQVNGEIKCDASGIECR